MAKFSLWRSLILCLLPELVASLTINKVGLTEAGVTENTVVITRGGDNGALYQQFLANGTELSCNFDGRPIVLSVPIGLKPYDLFAALNQIYQRTHELMVDQINLAPKCGVTIQGRNHPLELRVMGADSNAEKTAAVSQFMAPTTDFMLSPYSSGLAYYVSEAAHANEKLMFANGAVRPDVFIDRPGSFGVLPSGYNYMEQVLPMLAKKGAKSIYIIRDGTPGNFVKGLCAYVPDFAEEYGLELQGLTDLQDTGNPAEDFDVVARNLSRPELNPDIVVSCIDYFCDKWMASLRRVGWSPKALVLTVCPGTDSFENDVGTDREYVLGVNPWVPSLDAKDATVGWTAEEFAEVFAAFSGQKANYHAASAAAQVSLAVQAAEMADSLDYTAMASVVSAANSSNPIHTLYGEMFFTDIGQADLRVLGTQYDSDGVLQVVAPPEKADMEVTYPMPTWDNRDCVKLSPCGGNPASAGISNVTNTTKYSGFCQPDGTCQCDAKAAVAVGVGATAACLIVPNEDYSYINPTLKAIGVALMGIQLFASCFFIVWTLLNRKQSVIATSQPVFLVFVAVGCIIVVSAIYTFGVEGEYRYEQNPLTGQLTDIPNEDIDKADAACMAGPWLFGIGFVITFSALFAKIWRVRKILRGAQNFRREQVRFRDVVSIMVVLLALEVAILLAWQLVAPLRWVREVVAVDDNEYPTKSVGQCSSDSFIAFVIPYAALNIGCLLYALYLCYVTRSIPQKMNEGKWITASVIGIFQSLALGIPILIIVEDDPDAFYFLRVCLVFLISMSVTCFIFLPKVVTLYTEEISNGQRKKPWFFFASLTKRNTNTNSNANSSGTGGTNRGESRTGEHELDETGSNDSSDVPRRSVRFSEVTSRQSTNIPNDSEMVLQSGVLSNDSSMVPLNSEAESTNYSRSDVESAMPNSSTIVSRSEAESTVYTVETEPTYMSRSTIMDDSMAEHTTVDDDVKKSTDEEEEFEDTMHTRSTAESVGVDSMAPVHNDDDYDN